MILAPWTGIEPLPPALEGEVLSTRAPEKSLEMFLNSIEHYGLIVEEGCISCRQSMHVAFLTINKKHEDVFLNSY